MRLPSVAARTHSTTRKETIMSIQEKTAPRESANAHAKDRPPAEVAALLRQIQELLDGGYPKKALEAIGLTKIESPWLRNAAGVCQLRLGNPQFALDTLK